MKKVILLAVTLVFCVFVFGQKNEVWAGVEYNSHLKHAFNKTSGPGISLKGVHAFSGHFAGTASAGYNYFKGKVEYWDGSSDDHFALVPLLLGARYNFGKMFLGLEVGSVIKASSNAATLFAIVPSVGCRKNKFSSELRLLQVPGMPSFPENSILKKGGYNFLGMRLSCRIF
ncbi:MAG: hypothetical protein J7502_06440 [Flavisolibacter sp.]|nr:hypothetical protein [Flavisolibacter sp.]